MKNTTETIMKREMLQASVGPDIYEELKKAWQEEANSLQKSLEAWKEPEGGLLYAANIETAELVESMPLQSSLTEIPFRDESKGDLTSTVLQVVVPLLWQTFWNSILIRISVYLSNCWRNWRLTSVTADTKSRMMEHGERWE